MKRKINLSFAVVTFFAIVLTMLLSTVAFYKLFETEVKKDLKIYAHVLESSQIFFDPESVAYEEKSAELRITLISDKGIVKFDTNANIEEMDNHDTRPEVEEAVKNGEGYAVRLSDTLGTNTFYYAKILNNGYVLRVSKEANSILSVFVTAVPFMIGIMLFLFAVTYIITRHLTRNILRPIKKMADNLDEAMSLDGYKELQPFLNTIQKQHEDIMKNAQMRQQFTANVSHELKTPLTSISGYSELIENGMATDRDVQRFAKEIHRSSNRLLTLINDIIRLSELDAREDVEEVEILDLSQVARTAVDMLQINAEKHGVTLEIEGIPSYISGNRMMIEELIYNLIDNAIRYNNENGKVWVYIYNRNGNSCFCVRDTGIGIPKEHQERIFERFYRVDKSRSKSTGGTGLGLAIVKHIVAQHHAQIALESESGVGTTITVTFKAENAL